MGPPGVCSLPSPSMAVLPSDGDGHVARVSCVGVIVLPRAILAVVSLDNRFSVVEELEPGFATLIGVKHWNMPGCALCELLYGEQICVLGGLESP